MSNVRGDRKIIHDQTQDYLQRNGLLHFYQSGFRAIHSTDTCLSWLTYVNLHDAKNGKHTGMILIDLQKAFDTLYNTVLLDKMKCIGFQIKQKSSFNFTSQTETFFFHGTMWFRKQG